MLLAKSFAETSTTVSSAPERIMFHKFKIGEHVGYSPPRGLYAPQGAFFVAALLPERNGDFEYRIRHPEERHDRVVRESELHESHPKLTRGT
jgi:hypothetical protein